MNEIQLPQNLDDSLTKIIKEATSMTATYEAALKGFIQNTKIKDDKIKELEDKIADLTSGELKKE